jgi:hypothetical protein
MRPRAAAALLAALCLAVPLAAGAQPVAAGGAAPGPDATVVAQPAGAVEATAAEDRPSVTFVLDVRTDGDVRWTVRVAYDLADRNDTAAFRDLAGRWANRTTDAGPSADTFRPFADAASTATARSMVIRDADRSWRVENDTGVLELAFTWTNFGVREGSRVVVGDAFQTADGTWLPELEPEQALVVRPPPGFSVVSTPPGPGIDDETLRWTGPETFSPTYFADDPIVYEAQNTPSPTPTPTPTPSPPTTSPTPAGPDVSRGLVLGVLAAALLGGGMALYRRRRHPAPGGAATGTTDGGDGGAAGAAATDPADDAPADEADDEADDEASVEADETPPEPTPAEPFAGVDESLLSDEERVLRLLEANGGRMKQATIVAETGWSNAKVSQLLSRMADDDEIDKLRIGRENLISLPDVDVENVE